MCRESQSKVTKGSYSYYSYIVGVSTPTTNSLLLLYKEGKRNDDGFHRNSDEKCLWTAGIIIGLSNSRSGKKREEHNSSHLSVL